MSNPSITTFSQWAINTAGGSLPATQLIDRVSGRLGIRQETASAVGQNASLTERTNRMRVTGTPIEPSFSFEPTALEWSYLLPWLLGGTSAGATPIVYTPGNDLPLRGIQGFEDRNGSTKLHNYTNLAVDSFTIRSSPGQLVSLDVDCVGSSSVYDESTAFPTLTNFDNTSQPFSFPDLTAVPGTGTAGTFTIGGVSYDPFAISLTVNYNLDRNRRPHTLSAKNLRKRARDISLSLTLPAADAEAIYASDIRGLNALAVIAIWRNPVNGAQLFELSLPSVIFPRPDVDLPVREEVKHQVTGIAKYDGTNAPLVVSLQTS